MATPSVLAVAVIVGALTIEGLSSVTIAALAGVSGGATYDGLIALTASEHDL